MQSILRTALVLTVAAAIIAAAFGLWFEHTTTVKYATLALALALIGSGFDSDDTFRIQAMFFTLGSLLGIGTIFFAWNPLGWLMVAGCFIACYAVGRADSSTRSHR